MKSIDVKSLIIGVLGTLLILVSTCATTQSDEFGNITVKSISIGDTSSYALKIGDRYIIMSQKDEDGTMNFTSMDQYGISARDGRRSISMSNLTGFHYDDEEYGKSFSISPFLGLRIGGIDNQWVSVTESGFSISDTSNYSVKLVLDEGGSGRFELNDISGKHLVLLGSTNNNEGLISINNGGALNIRNSHNERVVSIQSNQDGDGAIALWDRYGDYGWGQTGKQ